MVAIEGMFMQKLQFQLGQWKFSPGWASSLSTLILLPLLVYLGCWQLSRFQEKINLQNELELRIKEPVLNFASFPEIKSVFETADSKEKASQLFLKQFRYRKLLMTGQFLNDRQLLLDNQILDGQLKLRVLTPFQLKDGQKLILVDRGFIPSAKLGDDIPPLTVSNEVISLIGTIDQISQGLQFKKATVVHENPWPLKVQYIDYESLLSDFSLDFYPFIVQIPADSPYAYTVRMLAPKNSSHRHLGYAIQWFAMALAVLIYYGVINCRRYR